MCQVRWQASTVTVAGSTLDMPFFTALRAEALYLADRTSDALEAKQYLCLTRGAFASRENFSEDAARREAMSAVNWWQFDRFIRRIIQRYTL